MKVALVAFGGNAILKANEQGLQEEQLRNAEDACRRLIEVIRQGYEMVIVHGNGPQVGNIWIQMHEAATKIPPFTLDVCGAMSEGSMGYMLQRSLLNQLHLRGIKKGVVTLITQVVVDPHDPLFHEPTKPIGPFYPLYLAEWFRREKGWHMIEDSGRGWRKVVPSPRPIQVVEEAVIRRLLEIGSVVIAAGGGGIPVYLTKDEHLKGIEAVIDKDRTSSLLAQSIKAELFIILTQVPQVYLHYGTPQQEPLRELSVEQAQEYLRQGEFPPGSMGPKIESAIEFIEAQGGEVLITSVEELRDALRGEGGTRIFKGG
ncbi:MAG: carbamate kinase [Acidobacteriota bacterium]